MVKKAGRTSVTWNPYNLQRLQELDELGVPYSQIAKEIGCSRNAVSGMLFRLRGGNSQKAILERERKRIEKAQKDYALEQKIRIEHAKSNPPLPVYNYKLR